MNPSAYNRHNCRSSFRPVLLLPTAILCLASMMGFRSLAAPGASSSAPQTYLLSRQVAAALLQGCDVAMVKVTSVGAVKRDPAVASDVEAPVGRLELKLAEWFNAASGNTNETLTVNVVRRPETTKQGSGPWTAWEGIEPRVGENLLIGLWTPEAARPTWEGRPLETAFVFAAPDRIEAARNVLRVHSEFLRQPVAFLSRLSNPNQSVGPADLGYFVGCVFDQECRHDVDAAARLSVKVIERRDMLPTARTDLIGKLEVEFYRLAARARNQAGQAFSEIAADPQDPAGMAALQTLARLVERSQYQLKLDDARKRALQQSYRKWLRQGGSAYPGFASKLGAPDN